MTKYRIYQVDHGHIVSRSDANCASDREACELAQRMLEGAGQAEVWDGPRCLGRVSAVSAAGIATLGRFSAPD